MIEPTIVTFCSCCKRQVRYNDIIVNPQYNPDYGFLTSHLCESCLKRSVAESRRKARETIIKSPGKVLNDWKNHCDILVSAGHSPSWVVHDAEEPDENSLPGHIWWDKASLLKCRSLALKSLQQLPLDHYREYFQVNWASKYEDVWKDLSAEILSHWHNKVGGNRDQRIVHREFLQDTVSEEFTLNDLGSLLSLFDMEAYFSKLIALGNIEHLFYRRIITGMMPLGDVKWAINPSHSAAQYIDDVALSMISMINCAGLIEAAKIGFSRNDKEFEAGIFIAFLFLLCSMARNPDEAIFLVDKGDAFEQMDSFYSKIFSNRAHSKDILSILDINAIIDNLLFDVEFRGDNQLRGFLHHMRKWSADYTLSRYFYCSILKHPEKMARYIQQEENDLIAAWIDLMIAQSEEQKIYDIIGENYVDEEDWQRIVFLAFAKGISDIAPKAISKKLEHSDYGEALKLVQVLHPESELAELRKYLSKISVDLKGFRELGQGFFLAKRLLFIGGPEDSQLLLKLKMQMKEFLAKAEKGDDFISPEEKLVTAIFGESFDVSQEREKKVGYLDWATGVYNGISKLEGLQRHSEVLALTPIKYLLEDIYGDLDLRFMVRNNSILRHLQTAGFVKLRDVIDYLKEILSSTYQGKNIIQGEDEEISSLQWARFWNDLVRLGVLPQEEILTIVQFDLKNELAEAETFKRWLGSKQLLIIGNAKIKKGKNTYILELLPKIDDVGDMLALIDELKSQKKEFIFIIRVMARPNFGICLGSDTSSLLAFQKLSSSGKFIDKEFQISWHKRSNLLRLTQKQFLSEVEEFDFTRENLNKLLFGVESLTGQ